MNLIKFGAFSIISKLFIGGLSWDTTDGIALLGPLLLDLFANMSASYHHQRA